MHLNLIWFPDSVEGLMLRSVTTTQDFMATQTPLRHVTVQQHSQQVTAATSPTTYTTTRYVTLQYLLSTKSATILPCCNCSHYVARNCPYYQKILKTTATWHFCQGILENKIYEIHHSTYRYSTPMCPVAIPLLSPEHTRFMRHQRRGPMCLWCGALVVVTINNSSTQMYQHMNTMCACHMICVQFVLWSNIKES